MPYKLQMLSPSHDETEQTEPENRTATLGNAPTLDQGPARPRKALLESSNVFGPSDKSQRPSHSHEIFTLNLHRITILKKLREVILSKRTKSPVSGKRKFRPSTRLLVHPLSTLSLSPVAICKEVHQGNKYLKPYWSSSSPFENELILCSGSVPAFQYHPPTYMMVGLPVGMIPRKDTASAIPIASLSSGTFHAME